jgi:hypothetical protein
MKSTIAAKHATAKKILICPQTIFLFYEILGLGCVEQIAARLIGTADCQQHRQAAGSFAQSLITVLFDNEMGGSIPIVPCHWPGLQTKPNTDTAK